ncbi:hypothetical protein SK803_24570 [Lentzea sp. BCCO 10_0856]|uniref:PH domain-containing protein n=1 Tax=Lentzea miocenica TaxID=3095431 RepID=A0ABU4T5F3_9PSEU|nr:hypothetical protein [Lentzea sp. BCCO 10_0856]MDX8033405.1 hypothetical protein [Lentzea sp. BCCO 10_0856]
MPTDLFTKPADADTAPALANGKPPRGLTPHGWVRTTGWLQVGDHPVSSPHIAALVGLLWSAVGAAVLVSRFPVVAGVLVLTTPAVCGVSWWLLITRVRPASAAVNVETVYADELSPGDLVRLYGSIGPVGQVAEVTVDEDVRVILYGGGHQSWTPQQVVHIAELLT